MCLRNEILMWLAEDFKKLIAVSRAFTKKNYGCILTQMKSKKNHYFFEMSFPALLGIL